MVLWPELARNPQQRSTDEVSRRGGAARRRGSTQLNAYAPSDVRFRTSFDCFRGVLTLILFRIRSRANSVMSVYPPGPHPMHLFL